MGRKIIIGIIATLITAALFAAYLRLTGTKGISSSTSSAIQDVADHPFDPQAKRIDDTVIHSVEQSRYIILDPQTRVISRIFGFEKLLNPGLRSNNWQVEKPYINLFENGFNCRMDAERGVFEVDTSGGSPSPQTANFAGKVVIRIQPTQAQQFTETVILMDDLSYSSERSEFFTAGPVELISAQIRLVGKGLLMMYNPASRQIDYFEIQKVEYLRLKNVIASKLLGQSETPAPPTPDTTPAVAQSKPAAAPGTAAMDTPQSEPNAAMLYRCVLNDTVQIVYGKQAMIKSADQINIMNIVFGEQPDTASKTVKPDKTAKTSADANQPTDKTPPAPTGQTDVEWANRTRLPATPTDDDANDVLVTCRGKMIFKPMNDSQITAGIAVQADSNAPAQADANESALAVVQDIAAESSDPAQKSAQFEAKKIDYDLTQGNAVAAGPVRFSFYTPADANDVSSSIPIVIAAQKNAEFFAGEKKSIHQVVFNGAVVGSSTEEKPAEKSIRRLYGDKLTIDLAADPNGKTQIKHVAVTDGDVRLEALRFRNSIKSAHVKLNCNRFDYDGASQTIVAAGPGEIQLNNQNIPAADPNAKAAPLDFRQPCAALVNGFDTLTWLKPENKIQVAGSKESMNLSYMTIKNGKPDAITNAQTMNAVLLIAQDATGHDILKELTADRGVFMEQVGQHTLKGQKLRYTGDNGWIHIEGDENQPCFVDGLKVPTINYNLQTGQLETTLSSSPGAVGVPQK